MANIDEISISTCIIKCQTGDGKKLLDSLYRIGEAGYKMVEMSLYMPDGDTEKIMDKVSDTGVQVWSVHGFLGMGAISPDEAERDKAVELAYRHAAVFARFAPCPLVEHYLDRHSDRKVADYFRDSIWKLYEKVSALGYTMCLETAPYKPKMYDRHPDSLEIAEFVRSFGKDDLQMIVDINHSNLSENLLDTAKNTRGLVKNIHVSNNNGTWEDHLPPNEGVIDIKQAFEAFRANGYTGPCNLEFGFPDDREPSVEKMRAMREYMENLLWQR